MIWPWYAGASIVLSPAPSRVADEPARDDRPLPADGVQRRADQLRVDARRRRLHGDATTSRRSGCASRRASRSPSAIWHAWKERTGLEIVEGIGTTENFALYLTNRPGDVAARAARARPYRGVRDPHRRRRRAAGGAGRDGDAPRQGRDRGALLPPPVRAQPPDVPRGVDRDRRPVPRGRRRVLRLRRALRRHAQGRRRSGSRRWRSSTR